MGKTKTNTGKNSIRDFLAGEITDIAVGTDGTDPTVSDTSLGNQILEKGASAATGGDGEVTHTIRLGTTEGNGSDLREVGTKDSAGDLEDRITFAAVTKTSDFEVEFRLKQITENK